MVALFLAASIGSTPPAVDAGSEQATWEEIKRVFTPGWPRLEGPSLAELQATSGLGDSAAPRTPEQTAWSEFGHHVSGLFIFAMGVLAILERTGWAPWARHWPLLIVGLTGFVAWSLDPEGWQTGRVGFWEHLLSPEVLQHRVMLAMPALLGIAEWRVRTTRDSTSRWRYVFPLVCIASGTLLMTHVHEVGDAKSAFLMELTHLPLGLVILVAGWARWSSSASRRPRAPSTVASGARRWRSSGCCSSSTARADRSYFAGALWNRFRADPARNHSSWDAPKECRSCRVSSVPSACLTRHSTGLPGARSASPRRLMRSSSPMRS